MLMRAADGQARRDNSHAVLVQTDAIDRIVGPAIAASKEMRETMARACSFIADRQDLDIRAIGKADQFLQSRRGFLAEIVAFGDEEP